jgi:crotonobetainyl-CoA:carnitine CoA-transferase CaiB-like acyl-CoA transferase
MRGGPLAGIRVVELTKVWAGPYIGKLLAFLGAEVIHVESEEALDTTRTYGVADINHAPGFMAVNPQKLSVQINTKDKKGVALLLDLIGKSDIMIENLRPGALDRMGLGYAGAKAVKPDIIFVSMGMYGNDGPLAYQTGYAPCFNALAGLSALVGYEGQPPAGMSVRYADSTFGAASAYATMVALLHRQRTGEGQYIDLSAVECMSSMIGDAIMNFTMNGVLETAKGARHPEMAPHGVYPCGDGEWLSLAVSSDTGFAGLAEAMGQPGLAEDTRFKTLAARKANEDELDRLIAAWTAGRDPGVLTIELQKRGVAAAKSQNTVDIVADANLWGRGFFPEVALADGTMRPILGPSWKITRGAEITIGAPRLGEHNAYVLGDILGLSAEEQERLTQAGVTR